MVNPYPAFVFSDYTSKAYSCERYRHTQTKRMYSSHRCMLDNNVLNLSNRKEAGSNTKLTVSIYDTPESFNKPVFPSKKSKETLPKKEIERGLKETKRQLLMEKFKDFYENKSTIRLIARKELYKV